jgi:hypothetical protein
MPAPVSSWLLASTLSLAAPAAEPVQLSWSAPDECPTQSALQAEVERYLGQALDEPRSQRVVAKAIVEAQAEGLTLTLSVETGVGASVTQVGAPDCKTLTDLTALKVAMAIDPMAVLDHVQKAEAAAVAQPEQPQGPAPEPEPEPEPKPVPKPEPEPKPARTVGGAVRIGANVGWGDLPGFGAGLGVAAALRLSKWQIEGGADFWFPREARFDDLSGVGGDLRLLAGHLSGCAAPAYRTVEFPLCVGIELGSMHGTGVGLAQPLESRRLWSAALVGPGVTWQPTRIFAIWLRATAAVPLVQPSFFVEDVGDVWRAKPAAIRGSAGVELRFP